MAKSRGERAAEAARAIRRLYRVGRGIGVTEAAAYRARRLADPDSGLSPEELERLCGLIRQTPPRRAPGGPGAGRRERLAGAVAAVLGDAVRHGCSPPGVLGSTTQNS